MTLKSSLHPLTPYNDLFSLEQPSYFPGSYELARSSFRASIKAIPKSFIGFFKIPSQIDSDLTVDWAFIPAEESNKKTCIIASGIHGPEAFAGSAYQQVFFSEIYPDLSAPIRKNTSFLVIHAVNPFGMKYFRRATENNVDLNRNFEIDLNLYKKTNEAYQRCYSVLNPSGPVLNEFDSNHIYKSLQPLISPAGTFLDPSFASGQYEHKNGLYFGGAKPEPHVQGLTQLFQRFAEEAEEVLIMDIHTGLGEKGELLFLTNSVPKHLETFHRHVFSGFEIIDVGKQGDYYSTSGDFGDFFLKLYPSKRVVSLTFEFGTCGMSFPTLLWNLWTLREENAGFHFGYKEPELFSHVRENYVRHFLPPESTWREDIIRHARHVMKTILPKFAEGSSNY